MRRLMLLAVLTSVLAYAPVAKAACAGAPAEITEIQTPVALFYSVDAGEDGSWLYEETNGESGLQRGGSQWVMAQGTVPKINPIPVTIPGAGPVPPRTITFFPSGFGGGSVADTLGGTDPCVESGSPDRIWF